MTIVAVNSARDVCRVFAGRRDAVMTGTASANDLRVVNRNRRHKQRCAVAVFADVARLNMCRTLARGGRAVMATDAVAGDAGVVE